MSMLVAGRTSSVKLVFGGLSPGCSVMGTSRNRPKEQLFRQSAFRRDRMDAEEQGGFMSFMLPAGQLSESSDTLQHT